MTSTTSAAVAVRGVPAVGHGRGRGQQHLQYAYGYGHGTVEDRQNRNRNRNRMTVALPVAAEAPMGTLPWAKFVVRGLDQVETTYAWDIQEKM